LCPACRGSLRGPDRGEAIPGIERVHIPWHYGGAARDLVLALKLRAKRPAALPLAAAVAGSIRRSGTAAEAITWVPGRRRDVRIRGFDHAELIAREVGVLTGLPTTKLLERVMDRPDQTTLSSQARWANLDGAFTALGGVPKVILVDDLVTTGATAVACAGALERGGTAHVEVAAPCRA
jgi:predicted amidophosphoribosyltransferase